MNSEVEQGKTKVKAREINEMIHYTSWTALHVKPALDGEVSSRERIYDELNTYFSTLEGRGVHVRGIYDLTALRADAEYMLWLHADRAEDLQEAIRGLKRTSIGKRTESVWSVLGLHRPAEFNKGHVPAFMTGVGAKDWVCVYPFVRSYEWYLLPEPERRALLIEHGQAGRDFSGILTNTVSAFALGDYEWILALESDELHEIVDMMRELRATAARRHVRVEIPFYTGRKIDINKLAKIYL